MKPSNSEPNDSSGLEHHIIQTQQMNAELTQNGNPAGVPIEKSSSESLPATYLTVHATDHAFRRLSQSQNRTIHCTTYTTKHCVTKKYYCSSLGRDENGKYVRFCQDPKKAKKKETDEQRQSREKRCIFFVELRHFFEEDEVKIMNEDDSRLRHTCE